MDLTAIDIPVPEGCNVILGQSHFIKTIEDLYEILVTTVPQARFGIAFSEASGPCLIRTEGNEQRLIDAAAGILEKLAAGHTFCIFLQGAFPLAVLTPIKNCPEVCRIFCATANPLQVVLASSSQGRGVMGVIDGSGPKGVETADDKDRRKAFLRTIGYKR
jgi:adenosine/AMP kinase